MEQFKKFAGKKILIIDDEIAIRFALSDYLKDYFFEIYEASDGETGMQVFQECEPDLVLLDLRLPKLDGLEILKKIRSSHHDIPVIIVSGAGLMEDAIRTLKYGAWDYLTKPIHDYSILKNALFKAFERQELIQQNTAYRMHLEKFNKELQQEVELHKQTEKRLRASESSLRKKHADLEEMNVALKVLLNQRARDRADLEGKIHHNIHEQVDPYLQQLKRSALDERQQNYIDIIETNLAKIFSTMSGLPHQKKYSLSYAELQVAGLIKQGKSTKEIADILSIAKSTVDSHRNHIREKLGIRNKKKNLRTMLQDFDDPMFDDPL